MERLIRNVRKGDRFVVRREDGLCALVTVAGVEEISRGFLTGKRRWMICGNYPWWWGLVGVNGYHNDKIRILPRKR